MSELAGVFNNEQRSVPVIVLVLLSLSYLGASFQLTICLIVCQQDSQSIVHASPNTSYGLRPGLGGTAYVVGCTAYVFNVLSYSVYLVKLR